MKTNFLDILQSPIRRKQRIISYGSIVLIVAIILLFIIPSQSLFTAILAALGFCILFIFFSGLEVSERGWIIICVLALCVFMLHSLYFGQSLLFYSAALAIFAIGAFKKPTVGIIAIILCTMWFERNFTLQSIVFSNDSYKLYPLDFVLIITMLSVAVGFIRKKLKYKWKTKFDLPILIFGLVTTANFLYVFFSGNNDPALAFGTYKNYFLYAIFYILLQFTFRTKEDWIKLFKWFTVGGVGLFFFLIYGIVNGAGLWSEYTPLSTAGSRLIAGTHIFFIILFGFWMLGLYFWPSDKFKFFTRKTLAYVLGIIGVGILVALVRHLWIALIILFVFWLVYMLAKEQKTQFVRLVGRGILIVVVVAVVYSALFVVAFGNKPKQISKVWAVLQERTSVSLVAGGYDSSASWRLSVWESGIQQWSFNPIFGHGLGKTLSGAIGDYIFDIAAKELHNNYLGILVQLGTVGALALIYWFYMLLKNMHAMWQKNKDEQDIEKPMLFFAINTVLFFMIIFAFSVYWDVNFFILWWWLAIALLKFLDLQHKTK